MPANPFFPQNPSFLVSDIFSGTAMFVVVRLLNQCNYSLFHKFSQVYTFQEPEVYNANLYRAYALYKSLLVLYKCQVKERAVILNGQFLLYFKSLVNKSIYLILFVYYYLCGDKLVLYPSLYNIFFIIFFIVLLCPCFKVSHFLIASCLSHSVFFVGVWI